MFSLLLAPKPKLNSEISKEQNQKQIFTNVPIKKVESKESHCQKQWYIGKRKAGTILCQTVGCTVVYATARGNQPLRSPQIILLYMDFIRWIPAQVHESGGYCTMRAQAVEGGEPGSIAKENSPCFTGQ